MQDYRLKFKHSDLELLYSYAKKSKFAIETGTGISTEYIARALKKSNGLFCTIDINLPLEKDRISNVIYLKGWTITHKDFVSETDPCFVRSNCARVYEKEALTCPEAMVGEKDLIRRTLKKHHDLKLDFFFSDSGEYCGLPEWRIVRDVIKVGGQFAAHDIYYPKSVKNFKVVDEIEKSPNWKVLVKTDTKQGLCIAEKLK